MTIGDLLPHDALWHVSILATDINPQFLERAREALYGAWSFRETPDDMRDRFWLREQERWRLRPEIRRMVCFARLNLAEPSYPSIVSGTTALDLLVCRNVTIYFDDATTRQVVDRFYSALAPGGWLIVGHSEPQASVYRQFEVHNFPDTVVYRKPLDAPLFPLTTRRGAEPAACRPAAVQPPSGAPVPSLAGSAARGKTLGRLRPVEAITAGGVPALPQLVAQSAAGPERRDTPDRYAVPSAEIAALIKLGRQCADCGDWPGAERYCEQALMRDSLCIAAYYLLAQIQEHQGVLDQALASYRRTVYLDRSFVPGLIGMANLWRQLGRIPEARRYYQAVLSQLAQQPATTPVSGAEGATAAELVALVDQQLRAIA
jgi:chemotaxis protein methyltransferase CheR